MSKNLLADFFQSQSDANRYLSANEQEALEEDFQKWYDGESKKLSFLATPLMRTMCENYHPNHVCIVTGTTAEISEGIECYKTNDFIVD